LLARAAVLIDLLVRSGQDESEAAQSVMRRLMAAGVPAPARGGDSRGWRGLLEFRNTRMVPDPKMPDLNTAPSPARSTPFHPRSG